MSKNIDVAKILLIVIIGMFIPFLGSLSIVYGMDITDSDDVMKIASTFGYFLLIFAIELIIVFIYYNISNKMAEKKLEEAKKK
jgi:hypothetical protein